MKDGLCPDMPLLVNDWLSSTKVRLMTPTERGGYLDLLCHAWNDPLCLLPDNDELLAKLSDLGKKWKNGSGTRIKECFQPDPERPGFIFNVKQRAVRAEQTARINNAKDHARGAAKTRWDRERDKKRAQAMPKHNPSTARAVPEAMPKNASSLLSPLSSLSTPPLTPPRKEEAEAVPLISEPAVSHEICGYWNSKTKPRAKSGMRYIVNLSDDRLRRIRNRLKDQFFRDNWRDAIDLVAASAFCRGDGNRGWRAYIDWFLRPNKINEIMEGIFDDNDTNPRHNQQGIDRNKGTFNEGKADLYGGPE